MPRKCKTLFSGVLTLLTLELWGKCLCSLLNQNPTSPPSPLGALEISTQPVINTAGQKLTAFSILHPSYFILYINHGPHCLHLALVNHPLSTSSHFELLPCAPKFPQISPNHRFRVVRWLPKKDPGRDQVSSFNSWDLLCRTNTP